MCSRGAFPFPRRQADVPFAGAARYTPGVRAKVLGVALTSVALSVGVAARAEPAAPSSQSETARPPDVIPDCEQQLATLGVSFRPARVPLQRNRGAYTCGTEQAVVYVRGPTALRYNIAPVVSCSLALALARFERLAQEEAAKRFGRSLVRVEQGGTYSCRKMSRFRHLVSEHSFANAIDIRAFVLQDGTRISILRDFGSLHRPPSAKGSFLRDLSRRLYDEAVFSVVLTPFWDALHRDHLHFDMARYRVDGTR